MLQKTLAAEVTQLVHGKDALEFAQKASEILFGNATSDILEMLTEEQLLQVLDGVPTHQVPLVKIDEGFDVVTALAEAGVFPSKGEARKMVQGGGVQINKQKVGQVDSAITADMLLHGKYLLVQRGKKNYHLLVAE